MTELDFPSFSPGELAFARDPLVAGLGGVRTPASVHVYVPPGLGDQVMQVAADCGLATTEASRLHAVFAVDAPDATEGRARMAATCGSWPMRDLAAPVAVTVLAWDQALRSGLAGSLPDGIGDLVAGLPAPSFAALAARVREGRVTQPGGPTASFRYTRENRALALEAVGVFRAGRFAMPMALDGAEAMLARLLADELPDQVVHIDSQFGVLRDVAEAALEHAHLVDVARALDAPSPDAPGVSAADPDLAAPASPSPRVCASPRKGDVRGR